MYGYDREKLHVNHPWELKGEWRIHHIKEKLYFHHVLKMLEVYSSPLRHYKGSVYSFHCNFFSLLILTLKLPWVTKTEFLQVQYQYNINQLSDENKEKYQFGDS